MFDNIKESDWKRFKEIHPVACERFAQQCLDRIKYELTDPAESASERFFKIRRLIKDQEQDWQTLGEDPRRSTALIKILLMNRLRVVTGQEMLRFSEPLRQAIESARSIFEKRPPAGTDRQQE